MCQAKRWCLCITIRAWRSSAAVWKMPGGSAAEGSSSCLHVCRGARRAWRREADRMTRKGRGSRAKCLPRLIILESRTAEMPQPS